MARKATPPPPVLVGASDSHFHARIMAEHGLDVQQELRAAYESGVRLALDIGTHPDDFDERVALVAGFDWVRFSLGAYPSHASVPADDLLRRLADVLAAQRKRVVAIGEIGVDNYHDYAPLPDQQRLFAAQVQIANDAGLPIVVHNRDASDEVAAVVRDLRPRGIMHCFSGDAAEAERFLELGMYISFAGNVTYPKNEHLRQAAAIVPGDRVLFETDAPFLSPVPARGRRNRPSHVLHTVAAVAELRGVDAGELAASSTENLRRLLGA
jgi:TatD DNase family protein